MWNVKRGKAGKALHQTLESPRQSPCPPDSFPFSYTCFPLHRPQVGSLVMGPEFNSHFEGFFKVFMTQLQAVVPPSVNIPEAYEKGTDDQQKFVQNLVLFFTGFFKVGSAARVSSRCCSIL